MSPSIANPYAKRKRAPLSSSSPSTSVGAKSAPVVRESSTTATAARAASSSASNSRKSSIAASLESVRFAAPATFSQAFQDTEVFHTNNEKKEGPEAQPESDATRSVRNSADVTDALVGEHPRMSSRDAHVLIQQPHVLYVSPKQRGNAVLDYIRNVPYAFARMVPDFIMSNTRCAFFLSMKYHNLYKTYIDRRIAELQSDFTLRVLLVLVDVEDSAKTLRDLNHKAVLCDLTLVLCWTAEEAARYLETFKAFDGKDASLIQKREQTHFADQVSDFLCSCKSVNKTDAGGLLSQFQSIRALTRASVDELALVSGMGEVKIRRLHDAFHKPFSKLAAKRRKLERQQEGLNKKSSQTTTASAHDVLEAQQENEMENSSVSEDKS